MTDYTKLPVSDYLTALSAGTSAPGGGAAAALTASQGVALMLMVLNFTDGHDMAKAPLLSSLPDRRDSFLEMIQQDIDAFNSVMAAYRLPRQSEPDKLARTDAIQTSLQAAAAVPAEIVREIAHLEPALSLLVEIGNKNLVTDTGIAASLFIAAIKASKLNLLINVRSMNSLNAASYDAVLASTEELIARFANIETQIADALVA